MQRSYVWIVWAVLLVFVGCGPEAVRTTRDAAQWIDSRSDDAGDTQSDSATTTTIDAALDGALDAPRRFDDGARFDGTGARDVSTDRIASRDARVFETGATPTGAFTCPPEHATCREACTRVCRPTALCYSQVYICEVTLCQMDHTLCEGECCPDPDNLAPLPSASPPLVSPSPSDSFGQTIQESADGLTLVAGAATRAGGGAIYVFERESRDVWWSDATWSVIESAGPSFGIEIALSADGLTLVTRDEATPNRVYRLERSTRSDAFATVDQLQIPSGRFALNADGTVLIASRGTQISVHERANRTATFSASTLRSSTNIPTVAGIESNIVSVALSADGTLVAAGDSRVLNFRNAGGAVHVFSLTGATIGGNPIQSISSPRTDRSSRFGNSVSFTSDGARLAVGDPGDSTQLNPLHHVYVFYREGGAFARGGRLYTPHSHYIDFAGGTHISADGSMLYASGERARGSANGSYWHSEIAAFQVRSL